MLAASFQRAVTGGAVLALGPQRAEALSAELGVSLSLSISLANLSAGCDCGCGCQCESARYFPFREIARSN
ncbi:MAG: hypothetical protein ACPIOQ_42975, partial [Promethearchaeia archaeon]